MIIQKPYDILLNYYTKFDNTYTQSNGSFLVLYLCHLFVGHDCFIPQIYMTIEVIGWFHPFYLFYINTYSFLRALYLFQQS